MIDTVDNHLPQRKSKLVNEYNENVVIYGHNINVGID